MNKLKVLFVRFSSLGDVILTTGIMKNFAELFDNAEIHILTSTEFKEIFSNEKHITKILAFDRKSGFSSYIKFVQDNINGYDYIIDLHGSLRSRFLKISTDANYFVYKKDSFKRRQFVKNKRFKQSLNKTVLEKYWEVLEKAFKIEKLTPEKLRPFINFKTSDENYIVLHSQTSRYTKTWPYMEELGQNLIEHGYKVVFIGINKQTAPDKALNLTGKTNLTQLIEIIAKASMVITTDSGPMHIATALNKNTVVIAGSTTKELGFLYEFENVKIIENKELKCRPCHVHGLDKCPEVHFNCMNKIKADDVTKICLKILNDKITS